MSGYNRCWTEQEELYLMESWGKVAVPYIAKKLDRTVKAIKIRAQKLNLGPFLMGGDYVSFNQLVIALTGHIENSYLKKSWIENRGLHVYKKRINQSYVNVVRLNEFWKWAKKNKSYIDFSRLEPFSLGKEPEWVDEQRRKDYKSFFLQCKTPWTPCEDSKLLNLLKLQKYTYKEISEILNRSEGSIQRRCTDLGTKLRPVKADNHSDSCKWNESHYNILAEGIRNGDSYALIGQKIGKSEKAVRAKVYIKYFTEDADKVRSMLQNREWGYGAPSPKVKQARYLNLHKIQVKDDLSRLVCLLKYRMNLLGYDPYWQRFMCVNWDDIDGCSAGCNNCDECTEFVRIKPQYCSRCGATFYERKSNDFCNDCRKARKKSAQKKWMILRNHRK